MPPLTLVDRNGIVVFRKRYSMRAHPAKREAPPIPEEDKQEQKKQEAENETDPLPDYDTAMRYARAKPKPRSVPLQKSKAALIDYLDKHPEVEGRASILRHYERYLEKPSKTEELDDTEVDESRQKQGSHDPSRHVVSDQPPNKAVDEGSKEEDLTEPYYDRQVEGWLCMLCLRWADIGHRNSYLHLKRQRWFRSLSVPEQKVQLNHMEHAADNFWRDKQTKRGGAKKMRRTTSPSNGQPSSAGVQQAQTTHGANQNSCKGGGDSCDSPPPPPSSQDSRSDLSEDGLAGQLAAAMQPNTLVSIRGYRAWLPARCAGHLLILELCTATALVFAVSSDSFSLIHQGKILPRQGVVGDWFEGNSAEIFMVRKPHPPYPPTPKRPMPVLDEIDLTLPAEQDTPMENEQTAECAAMEMEDKDIKLITLSNSRTNTLTQTYGELSVTQMINAYAKQKRVGIERISPYITPDPDKQLTDGDSLMLLIRKPMRGAGSVFTQADQ